MPKDPIEPGAACDACTNDASCDDDNPCTEGSCSPSGTCEHVSFCCLELSSYETSFEAASAAGTSRRSRATT